MTSKHIFGMTIAAFALTPVLAGCPGDDNPLCCTEFKVGATIDANIGGSAQSKVAVQAVSDFAGIASAAVDDLTTACRSIAQDLDAAKPEQDAAEQKADRRDKLNAWCSLAVKAIGSFKAMAGGSLTVQFDPPKCQASVSAKVDCQAKCSGSAQCDIKADPPRCNGGRLEVACKGECTAKAGATLKCEGKCEGECKGSCTASGGVQCTGKCQGTCKGAAEGGTGAGIKGDGSCDGTCEGTCEATAPQATCSGTCKGTCGVKCSGSAEASVKCDGECTGSFEPLTCEGGKLEGGCKVEAKCNANCDASIKAKAECRPPRVVVAFSGAANIEAAGKLQATFEANLGVILAFEARLEGMREIAGSFTASVGAVTDIKAACILPLVAAMKNAGEDVTASATLSTNLVATIK